ncbi:MAG: 5-(carboxyamino)imidazole ribonucleotide synthase [Burkholderiales bacterium]
MIVPGSWLGLLGGGQLGRMFCMAAQSMGYRVAVLDPGDTSPAGSVADRHIRADYGDRDGLATLAALVAAATTEFENVPAASLEYLGRRARVSPAADSVAIAQDRIREKQFLGGHGFAVVPFAVLAGDADARTIDPALLPGIVKSARFGYDGKGQIGVDTAAAVPAAFAAMGDAPCVLERRVGLTQELSVIVARNDRGDSVTWPVAENRHRDGILDLSIVPARITPALAAEARAVALQVAAALDYRGVLCVELFVVAGDRLLINEIAPRPHNSGHYTIDACITSQFEQQVRVLADLPLGDTRAHGPAVMVNLLGDIWFEPASGSAEGLRREPDWRAVLEAPEAKLHLYGKSDPRRGRKMGHVTCVAPTLAEAMAAARGIRQRLRIPDDGEL